MDELNNLRYDYYKLCYNRAFNIVEKMYNLLGNTQLVVGNLPIIKKFEKELDSLKKVMSEDLHQAILRLIREDNYKTVPKLRKKEEC